MYVARKRERERCVSYEYVATQAAGQKLRLNFLTYPVAFQLHVPELFRVPPHSMRAGSARICSDGVAELMMNGRMVMSDEVIIDQTSNVQNVQVTWKPLLPCFIFNFVGA